MTTIEAPPVEVLARTFEATVAGDGRTVEARIVPYNIAATVADPPDYRPYQEMFMPGAFQNQLGAANRVFLNFEHEQGLRGIVGHGETLDERADGLYGSFRIGDHPDGAKALELVHEGVLDGLSIEFKPDTKAQKTVAGVVQRFRAHLDRVSLCRFPAYPGAQVLAVREQPPAVPQARPVPVPPLNPNAARFVEPLRHTGVSAAAWDGASGRFTDDQYERSCLVDQGGDGSPKTRCSVPVLDPDGAVNVNALPLAATRLTTRVRDARAARLLIRYYAAAGVDPPGPLRKLAAS